MENATPSWKLLFQRHRLLYAVLAFGVLPFFLSAATCTGPGLTWDESIYFGFAANYWHWFTGRIPEAFSAATLRRVWSVGQAHPPLGKLATMFSFVALDGLVDLTTAARFGASAFFGGLCLSLFFFMKRHYGSAAGAATVVCLILMPRFLGHARLASLEMPMALTWVLTTITFVKGIHSRKWSVICGVCFGLAMLTKINAVFLPVALILWGVLCHGRKVIPNAVCMALIGPAVFVAGWPALWHHPASGIAAYLRDKTRRMLIPVHYFGTTYADRVAPFHYPLVMLLITTPLVVLIPAAAGLRRCVRNLRSPEKNPIDALIFMSFAVPVVVAMLPGVPRYDGVRLFLPALPFLACMAGIGIVSVWTRLKRGADTDRAKTQPIALFALLLSLCLLVTVLVYPFSLSYYNAFVMGPWGAEKVGMEITYWGDTLDSRVIDYLNRNCPKGGRVVFAATGSRVFPWLRQVTGEVRKDIRLGSFERRDWDLLVVVPRQGWLEANEKPVADFIRGRTPVWTRYLTPLNRLPVCLIYARPKGT